MSIFGIDSRSTPVLQVIAALSKWIAKKSTGAEVILNPSSPTERWQYGTVARMAKEAVYLCSKEKMVSALQRLQANQFPSHLPDQVAAFGIWPSKGGAGLFRSHPPIEDRIMALRNL